MLATHDLETLDVLADRCVVFGEDHRVAATGPTREILGDRDLLLGVNLIHERSHLHHPHDRAFSATGVEKRAGARPNDTSCGLVTGRDFGNWFGKSPLHGGLAEPVAKGEGQTAGARLRSRSATSPRTRSTSSP